MCGRYARRSDKQRIAEHFRVHGPSLPDFGPSWNIAPQTLQPIVRLNGDTGERELVLIALGSRSLLGKGREDRPSHDQCKSRDDCYNARRSERQSSTDAANAGDHPGDRSSARNASSSALGCRTCAARLASLLLPSIE
ncbi:MAG TPA: SOS response-associated peptidase family protein [Silvibacterium sp.]|nr:SOS response-associated peptidase family protein [Silvibacterium sp.]